jgi:hypothetical protein
MTRAERFIGVIKGGDPADEEDTELRRALFQALSGSDVDRLEAPQARAAPPAPPSPSARHRNKAEELRSVAEGCKTPAVRASLLRLAHDYEVLAEFAEDRGRQQSQAKFGL